MATKAAYDAWVRVFSNPETVQQSEDFESRAQWFRYLWHYYSNSVFENKAEWTKYKREHLLYRSVRSIYNPVRRLVDFYAGQVYPGVLSEDGLAFPDGRQSAIPFPEDTDEALRLAIAQFWQWSNWQAGKALHVRFAALCGSSLVEIVDDLDSQKVSTEVIWPGLVADLELDGQANVHMYALEYTATDENGSTYTYRKEVDKDSYRTFKDDHPFDYSENGDQGVEWENPYGFVPAIWNKHRDTGGLFGAPVISGSIGKIDELNSLASHLHDQLHRSIHSPWVMWGAGTIKRLTDKTKRTSTEDFEDEGSEQQSSLYLEGPAGGNAQSLTGNLDLEGSMTIMNRLMEEIEADHPELLMYRELRGMTEVTGPGATRIMGDVDAMLKESQAGYDQQSIKLFQMAVAIAGWRLNNGDWTNPTRQHEKFRNFDLESYDNGDLDLTIDGRPLIPETDLERYTANRTMWDAVGSAKGVGVPLEWVLKKYYGWSDEDIQQMLELQANAAAQALVNFNQGQGFGQGFGQGNQFPPAQAGNGQGALAFGVNDQNQLPVEPRT